MILVLLKTKFSIFMDYRSLSDQQLLHECSLDNLKAFNTLFERYFAKLYQYALKYIREEHLAEEAMMDLMYWVWDKRHQLDIQGEFAPYIFRAAKNATLRAIRKKALETCEIHLIENDLSYAADEADTRILRTELQQQYHRELELLSPQRKVVFRMSREEQLSHAEIAEALDISIHTVKNHIKFSLNQLRKSFARYRDAALALIAGILLYL